MNNMNNSTPWVLYIWPDGFWGSNEEPQELEAMLRTKSDDFTVVTAPGYLTNDTVEDFVHEWLRGQGKSDYSVAIYNVDTIQEEEDDKTRFLGEMSDLGFEEALRRYGILVMEILAKGDISMEWDNSEPDTANQVILARGSGSEYKELKRYTADLL